MNQLLANKLDRIHTPRDRYKFIVWARKEKIKMADIGFYLRLTRDGVYKALRSGAKSYPQLS